MQRSTIDSVKQFKGRNILVIGDVMADHYIDGKVERICPEAPVPILKATHHRYDLGGAANAAKYAACLGAKVSLFGRIGVDKAGSEIKSECGVYGIHFLGIIDNNYITTTKNRALNEHNHQIMFRWDDEQFLDTEDDFDKDRLEKLLQKADAVILSDYDKGFISRELAKFVIERHKRVIVDPKKAWDQYAGAYIVKPNNKEFNELRDNAGYTSNYYMAHRLNTNLIVTMGEEGMMWAKPGTKTVEFIKTEAKDVVDVTGAGDMVAAVLALSAAIDLDIEESISLANYVASLKIQRKGTSPVWIHELLDLIEVKEVTDRISHFVKDENLYEDLEINLEDKVVFTNGCFDLLHDGHIELLKKAKALGTKLIVGLNSDESVRRLKGEGRPVQSEVARATVLASIKYVDHVVIFDEDTPEELIEYITPDVLTKGSDYDISNIVGASHVIEHGGAVETIDLIEGSSTSSIIDKIKGY